MSHRRDDGKERATRGRILIAKLGLDGHDVGAKVVTRALRDAGFEVIYLGIRQTPEAVAAVARDEDVDVIGVSMLSGAHLRLIPRLLSLIGSGQGSQPVVMGGSIPETDHAPLLDAGVAAVVGSHARSAETVDVMDRLVRTRRERAATNSEPRASATSNLGVGKEIVG